MDDFRKDFDGKEIGCELLNLSDLRIVVDAIRGKLVVCCPLFEICRFGLPLGDDFGFDSELREYYGDCCNSLIKDVVLRSSWNSFS